MNTPIGSIPQVPIVIKQGATFYLPVYYLDQNGVAIPLTDYGARMIARKTAEAIGDPLFDLTEGSGITITDATGLIEALISATVTGAYDAGWVGVYEFYLISPGGGSIVPLFEGEITVEGGAL